MKIQSHNRFDNTFRSLSVIILVLLAALLVAPSALADKCFDRDGNLKPHAKPSCGSSGTQFPEQPDTIGYFYDNHAHPEEPEEHGHFVDEGPRNFVQSGLDFGSGDFVAVDLDLGIWINTSELSTSSKGNSRGLCRKIEDGILFYAEKYTYGWVDDCTDGDCAIEIRLDIGGPNSSSEQDILSLSEGKSNQVEFVMHSVIMGTDANPFAEDIEIPIHRAVAEFKKTGTTRTLITCEYTPSGWSGPVFHSFPR